MRQIEDLKKYMNHLPTCNKMQDWTEAQQAMSDTPSQFIDEGWSIANLEMKEKMNTCTCGMENILQELSHPLSMKITDDFERIIKKIGMAHNTEEAIRFCNELHQQILNEELEAQDKNSFESLFDRHKTFAEKTFPESTAESSLKGLEREIKELRNEPDINKKGIEYIDCLFYWADSFYRAGFSLKDMKLFMNQKLSINESRDWDKNEDNTYSHKK